jgi:hypothetical protein
MTTLLVHRPAPPFVVLVRSLQIVGGFVTMYGLVGMFSSDGLRAPNLAVYLGLGLGLFAIILQRAASGRWRDGWWAYTAALSAPLVATTLPTLGSPECPIPHQPISADFYCVSAGSHGLFAIAVVLSVISIAGGVRAVLLHR